ncbi:MAG: N-acetyltransferase [Sphingobacteriales bacterium]|nr:N-acetyltransferase [Sphingobacteriales bacterium]
MVILHKQTGGKGIFFIGEEGAFLAEMVYTLPSPGKMIIEHTEVSEELRGQNIGYQLVSAAVDYARHHSLKIIPLCPFANAVFKKKPEFADILFS